MKPVREWLAATILATGGAVLALVMLEGGVRWLHLVPDRFWERDPVLGLRLTAGKNGWWTQEEREFLVPVRINSRGLRDVEHDYEKPVGVARILVLGDSFVEALQVPLEETFTRLLEGQLTREDVGRVEVISAGISGYGTAGEVLFFEREGIRYRPDLVLLAFYPGNDVCNNSPELEDTLRPVYDASGALEKVVADERAPTGRVGDGLLVRSSAYRYLRQLVLTRQPALAKLLADLRLLKRDATAAAAQKEDASVAYGVYADPLAPEWEAAWKRTEVLLMRLHNDVQDAGARLAIVVVPSREQIYPGTWDEIVAGRPSMTQGRWDLDAPGRHLEAWCSAHRVPCVPLVHAFRRGQERAGEMLHYRYDGHWTAAGHRIAAAALAGSIKRHGWLPLRQEEIGNEAH